MRSSASSRYRSLSEPLRSPSPPFFAPRCVRAANSRLVCALRLSRSAVGSSFGLCVGPPEFCSFLAMISSTLGRGKIGTKVAIEIGQMVKKIVSFAAITFLVFGCSRSGKVQRNQQQYQTVQEGSASGVTSTINAPGETTPPMTNTNVDTTTNLTLPTNPAPLGTIPSGGSMASAMPGTPPAPAGAPAASAQPSRPRTSTRPTPVTNAPVVTDTVGSTTPPMPRERAPQPAPPREQRPPTDTAATDTAAPPPPTDTMMTDTSSTTSTSPSTDTKKKDDGKKKDGDQPPPPPTATDTRG